MLSGGGTADDLYLAAIKRLGQSHTGVGPARTHLLYDERLRRENRRVDARQQLHRIYEMLGAMRLDGFAERDRRELLAVGETVRKRRVEMATDLTPQELQVARRARGRTDE